MSEVEDDPCFDVWILSEVGEGWFSIRGIYTSEELAERGKKMIEQEHGFFERDPVRFDIERREVNHTMGTIRISSEPSVDPREMRVHTKVEEN